MRKQYLILVHFWSPNGTNDVSILEYFGTDDFGRENYEEIDFFEGALFGLELDSESEVVPLDRVLKYVAISPVSDGTEFLDFLRKYFPINERRTQHGPKKIRKA